MKGATVAGLAAVLLGVAAAHDSTASKKPLIAFWSDRAGLPGVWVMKPGGAGRRLLTGTRSRAKRGDLSPDGRKLVFDGQPAKGAVFDLDIQVIGVDGRGRRRLTHGSARDIEPRWSPDGRTIVFQRQYGDLGSTSIWTIRRSGTQLRRLTGGSAPIWSPDGRKLLIARETTKASGSDVYRVNADGTRAGLFFRSSDDDFPAVYSRDGRWILLTRLSRTHPRADVYKMRADGSRVRRLTHCRNFCYASDFSPDGRHVLFTRVTPSTNTERGQVFVMGSDGSHPHNLSRNRADENAADWWP